MGHVYFITGIGTEIGKTHATGILAKNILRSGKSVITQKVTQTGVTMELADDIVAHRQLMQIEPTAEDVAGLTCPYTLKKAASPHLAARLEDRHIDHKHITACTKELQDRYEVVLLESAGGVLVPLTDELLVLDYVAEQGYPVIVVTTSQLGSLNHTFLTLEAIKTRGLALHSLIYNHYFDGDFDISNDSRAFLQAYIQKHYPKTMFLELWDDEMAGMWGVF